MTQNLKNATFKKHKISKTHQFRNLVPDPEGSVGELSAETLARLKTTSSSSSLPSPFSSPLSTLIVKMESVVWVGQELRGEAWNGEAEKNCFLYP